MSAFTTQQRTILIRRVARAILWSQSDGWRQEAAESTARAVVQELEISGFSAGAQRRAVDKIIANLEEPAA
jgi:hypothetical protein